MSYFNRLYQPTTKKGFPISATRVSPPRLHERLSLNLGGTSNFVLLWPLSPDNWRGHISWHLEVPAAVPQLIACFSSVCAVILVASTVRIRGFAEKFSDYPSIALSESAGLPHKALVLSGPSIPTLTGP